MTWAPQETQIAIFTRLNTDTALLALLGTTTSGAQKIFDYVPEGTLYPYVTMEIKPWEDRSNHTTEGLSCDATIHVWYQPGKNSNTGNGDKQTQLIQKRIEELLHKYNLVVSGWKTLQLRRKMIDIITEPDNVTKHGVQQFKIFLGGN